MHEGIEQLLDLLENAKWKVQFDRIIAMLSYSPPGKPYNIVLRYKVQTNELRTLDVGPSYLDVTLEPEERAALRDGCAAYLKRWTNAQREGAFALVAQAVKEGQP